MLNPRINLRSLTFQVVHYYWVKQTNPPDKYSEGKEVIQQIFEEHQGRYGYRRIIACAIKK